MICVEGYKAFRGAMEITPKNKDIQPATIIGDWLYKPDTDCWYGGGRSFPASICQPMMELEQHPATNAF